jgi:hypothetical protein
MNERIDELAEQCRIETYGINGELLEFGFDAEKFAELIVKECITQCWTVSELESKGFVVSECSKRIRKHFGVEE